MADSPPSTGPQRSLRHEDKRGFLQKLAEFIPPGPDAKDELIETLAEAEDNDYDSVRLAVKVLSGQ